MESAIRKLPAELMSHEGEISGLTPDEAAQRKFELLHVLAPLEYRSAEYIGLGTEFRAKKYSKPLSPDRPTLLAAALFSAPAHVA